MTMHELMLGLLVFEGVYTIRPTLICRYLTVLQLQTTLLYNTQAATFQRHEMKKCPAYEERAQ